MQMCFDQKQMPMNWTGFDKLLKVRKSKCFMSVFLISDKLTNNTKY